MESRALLLPVSGDARVVHLPGRDELARLCTIYDLIGCRYAEVVPLAADVTMWLDEEATVRPGPVEPSRPAMLIGAALGHADRYVGTAVSLRVKVGRASERHPGSVRRPPDDADRPAGPGGCPGRHGRGSRRE